MPTTPAPQQSTRLENLGFESDGARFELDGRSVRIKKDIDPSSVAALRTFYLSALAELQTHAIPRKPGPFARIKAWIGRLFSARPDDGPPAFHPQPLPAEPGPVAPRVKPAPAPQMAPEPPSLSQQPRQKPGEPVLRAVFADGGGVHLHWQSTAKGTREDIECRYDLDSELAQRLQSCYGHLDRLGYKVVGLDLLKSGARPVEKKTEEPEKPQAVASEKAPEKKDPMFVMRLHPETTDQPDRALVSPIEDKENLQVLVAPEKLLKALRSGADPSKGEAERVTYLRCTAGKSGLKVVDVGIGQGKENSPARWEEVSKWLPNAEPTASAKRAKSGPLPTPETPAGPQPELEL